MADFTILTKEQYEKYGFPVDAQLTDFAILNGAKVLPYIPPFRANYGYYWTPELTNPDAPINKHVYCITSNEGYTDYVRAECGYVGIRPAIYLSSIPEEYLRQFKYIKKINSQVELFEFGYYPQSIVAETMQAKLDSATADFKYADNIYKKDFIMDEYSNPIPKEIVSSFLNEFEYKDDNYVQIRKIKGLPDSIYFSKLVRHVRSNFYVEVEPVRWFVNNELGIMVTEKIIYAGIPYHPNRAFDHLTADFSKVYLKFFLDNQFFNNLVYHVDTKKDIISKEYTTFIPDDAFRGSKVETLSNDFSNIEEIGVCAFENCENLKELTFSPKIRYVSLFAFDNCPSLKLNIQTSFFQTPSCMNAIEDLGDSIVSNTLFYQTFNVRELNIFDTKLDLNNTNMNNPKEEFFKIRTHECQKIIEYILDKYHLNYNIKYFDNYIQELISKNLSKKEIREHICNSIYDYLCLHKIFMGFNAKKRYIKEIDNYFDLFYIDYFKAINIPKVEKKTPILRENPLNNKTIKEVYKFLENEKIPILDSSDAIGIMEYGSKFDIYFGYIANKFSVCLSMDSELKEELKILIGLFKECELISNSVINEELLNQLLNGLENTQKSIDSKLYTIAEIKKLLELYVTKISEMNKYLNDKNKNNYIESKIISLNNLIINAVNQLDAINSIMENDFNYRTILDNINKTLFPKLLLMINNQNGNNKEKKVLFRQIVNSLDSTSINDDGKQKKLQKRKEANDGIFS